jgi:hypothetical protein
MTPTSRDTSTVTSVVAPGATITGTLWPSTDPDDPRTIGPLP